MALSQVAPERLHCLSPGRLAAGKITVLDGDPGNAKSTLLCEFAARISRGDPLPGGRATPPRVVIPWPPRTTSTTPSATVSTLPAATLDTSSPSLPFSQLGSPLVSSMIFAFWRGCAYVGLLHRSPGRVSVASAQRECGPGGAPGVRFLERSRWTHRRCRHRRWSPQRVGDRQSSLARRWQHWHYWRRLLWTPARFGSRRP